MSAQNNLKLSYGYLVCLVTVITFLFSSYFLVKSIIDLNDPDMFGYNSHLQSFEVYKQQITENCINKENTHPSVTTLSCVPADSVLMKMYLTEKNDKISQTKFNRMQSLISLSFLVIISAVLFVLHWILLRKTHAELKEALTSR
jgi:hypothetical protein